MSTVEMTPAPTLAEIPDVLNMQCSHCHGTAMEPEIVIRPEWRPVLRALQEAGEQRRRYGGARVTGERKEKFYDAIDQIRELLFVARDELKIPSVAVEWAVGVGRVHIHNIRWGKTGRPLSAAHLARLKKSSG